MTSSIKCRSEVVGLLPRLSRKYVRSILACAGIAAILFTCVRLRGDGQYPGAKVALPVAGGWLLIAVVDVSTTSGR